ncbi:MAG: phosphatase PAP2 family protein [Spirochaetaceae bacterium]|nr:MAG: phosphatase PAP2 family protein [Spirochaetaceae bacterium]
MNEAFSWGIQVIHKMQDLGGPLLTGFFRGITFLGAEEFYLLLLSLVFWSLDTKFGARLVYVLLISGLINYLLKDLFAQPRPFVLEPGINLIATEGYGLPSGHSQTAVVVWGTLASRMKKPWAWVAAVIIMLLIGITRIYLGVHFPTDVLTGWVIGAVLLSVAEWIVPGVFQRAGGMPMILSLTLITGITAAAVLLHPTKESVAALATFWGYSHGLLFLSRYFSLSCSGSVGKRIARYPIGLVVTLLLYLGLKVILPQEGEKLYLLFRFIRYALLGLWIGLGAPLVFRLLRLTKTESSNGQPSQ